ncbi:ATP-dependent DNA helicase 2 subunit KU70 [Carex littledalei]|uniref:ATP-dependent DNA helicase 2 subunit KU70 n=1 Tax=Carex littledalei TaxID=544730 RepID=A0A833V3L8_9POAL|nr:ATP-dependent DNA helicase 2 subunit KU70 [Carex littledalei]
MAKRDPQFKTAFSFTSSLQRHYGALQVFALGDDEMPVIKDEILSDEEGLSRPGVVKAIDEFKTAVYGEEYNE